MSAPLHLRNKIWETISTCLRSVVLVDHFYSPHHCQWATKKVLDSFVRSIKRGNCPAFKWYNLLITGFTFVGFIDIKGIDCTLSGYWLLVEVIVPTVFIFTCFLQPLFVVNPSWFFTNLHWAVKKTITVILFKWSLFGLGDAFANFDQLTSLPRLFILSIGLKSISLKYARTYTSKRVTKRSSYSPMRYLLPNLCPHLVILAPCPIVFLSVFGTQLIKSNKDPSLNLRGQARTRLNM